MKVHTTTRKHWAISDEGKGCPRCGATKTHRCRASLNGPFLPWNTVHVERVAAMSHSIDHEVLPIHRSKLPKEYLDLLRSVR